MEDNPLFFIPNGHAPLKVERFVKFNGDRLGLKSGQVVHRRILTTGYPLSKS